MKAMKKQNAMGCLQVLLVAAGLVVFVGGRAQAGSVKVVANSSVGARTVSVDELKSVFLQEKNSLADGSHVVPVLEMGGPAHEAFLKEVLGKNSDTLQDYYRSLVFTGKGSMPKALHSDEEVVAYVARTRGAIGYVSSSARVDGVKTLAVHQVEREVTRKLISRVEPVYPVILLSNHIGGTVRLQVTIAANGTVEDVELLGGNPILGEAAMAAVKKWLYAADRSPTETEVSISFNADR
jgi:TonB family protein